MPFAKGQSGNPGGRPKKSDKFAAPVAKAEKQIADKLPKLIENMLLLANGGYEVVSEEWAPAGSLYVGTGQFLTKMYPDKPDDELVLVKRSVGIASKDRAANQYLIDRIMGKPTERQEISGPEGEAIRITTEAKLQAEAELAEWRKQQQEALRQSNT